MMQQTNGNTQELINYVTGFIYDNYNRFLLVEKTTGPAEVIGKLNGIGGKIEETDFFPTSAIDREVKEEIGLEGLEWHTTGLIVSEGQFVNIIFHTKVDDLNKLNYNKVNDRGEQVNTYILADVVQGFETAMGVPAIMAHLIYGNPTTDKIEITRYSTDMHDILFADDSDAVI